jgi:DNA-directed RNA polymerase specialized sigma24 family protein
MFVNDRMNPRQVGIALHVPDSTVRDRLERAAAKMRHLRSSDVNRLKSA